MRTLVGFGLSLLLAPGLFAQHRGGFSNPHPFPRGTFGGVAFPASAAQPSGTVARQGTWRQPSVSGAGRTVTVVPYGVPLTYAYPVFVGGYVDNSYAAEPAPPPQPDTTVNDSAQSGPGTVYGDLVQPQPDTTVNNLTQPASAMIMDFGSEDEQDPSTPSAADNPHRVERPASTNEPSHYLIAFKDHSIYSAVAYWVDGDTLHYFTSGNTHNQASLSLVDRDLTERLNKESGLDVRLP
jgi:hypothetical protein